MKEEFKLAIKMVIVFLLFSGIYTYFENSKRNQQISVVNSQLSALERNKYIVDKLGEDEQHYFENSFTKEPIITNKFKNRYIVFYKKIPTKICADVLESQKEHSWKTVNQISYSKFQDPEAINEYCSSIEEKDIDLTFVTY